MSRIIDISAPFLERAAIDEFAERLRQAGYETVKETKVHDVIVDLIAKRDTEVTFYEFKLPASEKNKASKQVAKIQKLAREQGAKFSLVIVRPPIPREIEFEGLNQLLEEYFRENVPNEVADIAGGTLIDEVADVEIMSLAIGKDEIHLVGDATLGVTLTTGSGEPIDSLGFPISFEATVGLADRQLINAHLTGIDDTVWYGDPDER